MGVINRVLQNIKERRERVLSGKINCIPVPFPRFRNVFPGIEQKRYFLVSGATKSGKTQFTNYIFVYNTLMYAYYHPDKVHPTIFYYNLEEDEEDITSRFMCFLLYTLSGIELSTKELNSTDERKPLDHKVIETLESEEYQKIMKFYEDHVHFMPSRNPTGQWKDIIRYADEHGKSYYEDIIYTDEFGVEKKRKKFSHYIPDDPDEYVIIITDHVSLLEKEKDMKGLKDAIDKLSEYYIIFRNRFKYIPVVVQQQNIETLGLDAVKADRIRPTIAGLADSKNTGKDCSVMFGITNPSSVDKETDLGYDITKLRGRFRSLQITANRHGESNDICPLWFKGNVNFYKELPLPNTPELIQVYKSLETPKASKSFLMYSIKKLINRLHG